MKVTTTTLISVTTTTLIRVTTTTLMQGILKSPHVITHFFFISIIFISITRLKSVENKHKLSITKAQILPQDELKNGDNQA